MGDFKANEQWLAKLSVFNLENFAPYLLQEVEKLMLNITAAIHNLGCIDTSQYVVGC